MRYKWSWSLAAAATLISAGLVAGACLSQERSVPLAFVAAAGNNHVQVIDLTTGETLRKIYAGPSPWRLVPSPDGGQIWAQHWYSGTTAVIGVEAGEVERVLPYRGPGTFSPDGRRFLTLSWPGTALVTLDARSLEPLAERVIEVSKVHHLAFDPEGELLYLVRFDPMTRPPRERYGYILALRPEAEEEGGGAAPASLPTGVSPVQVRVLDRDPFFLTADSGTNGLSLLNRLGDRRVMATCPAPRAILLSPDESRMVVTCWRGEETARSQVVSYRADFSRRPWPELVEERTATFPGILGAGAFSPSGEALYLADRLGARLLEVDPRTLELRREIATGDVPMDLVVVPVSAVARRRLAAEAPARQRLRGWLAQMGAGSRPFTDLAWSEVETVAQPSPPPAEGAQPEEAETPRVEERVAQHWLRPPDSLRVEPAGGGLRLAEGGHTLSLAPDGRRFWVAPRQELVSVLFALPALSSDEALARLAGDVPGSPFLRAGLAVDLVAEVEEEGTTYRVIGIAAKGDPLAQLWVEADNGRPAVLVEQFPAFGAAGHGGGGGQGFLETHFFDHREVAPGLSLPGRLQRRIPGLAPREVRIEEVVVDGGVPEAQLDLARLGGVAPPSSAEAEPPAPARPEGGDGDGGPGRRVAILQAGYLEAPGQPHPPYNSQPPTSGPRLADLAQVGVHALPVPLELQVHNLEHGAVALQYNCPQGCPELVSRLEAVAAEHDGVLVAPYPWMDGRLALTAWGRIQTLEDFDEAAVQAFIQAYGGRDHHAGGGEGPGRPSGH